MKKKPILIRIALFFPTIFNILFWSLCKEYNVSVWISYSFIHIAWLANIIVFIRGTDSSHDRSVTSYPGYIFSILYRAAELLMGIIFIIIAPDAFFITLTANLILFAVYLILIFRAVSAESKIEKDIEVSSMDREYIKKASHIIKNLCMCSDDTQIHNELDRLYNIISSSPVRSNAEARDQEMKVLDLAEELNDKIDILEKEKCLELIKQIKSHAVSRNSFLM